MTYGWVILVVLVSVGTLVHLTSPVTATQPPSTCNVGPPIICDRSYVTEEGVSMRLYIHDSRTIEIQKIEVFSDAIRGECSWNSTGKTQPTPHPTLEGGYQRLQAVYTLSSAGNSFIPTSTGETTNFNGNATSNSSLVGCEFSPDTSLSENQYEFTVTYNWKNSGKSSDLTHSATGQFVNRAPGEIPFLQRLKSSIRDLLLPAAYFLSVLLFLAFVRAFLCGVALFVLRRR